VKPVECYHLAAHHHAAEIADPAGVEAESHRVNVRGTAALLDALSRHRPRAGVFLASSCHVFGDPVEVPQSETTPFAPDTPYARSKAEAISLGAAVRARGQRVSSGILYNHESPLRRDAFVTARIARGVAEIARGRRSELTVGSQAAKVDWSWAEDVIDAMVRMARAEDAGEYIVASGVLHSVAEFAMLAFARAGLDASRFLREDAAVRLPPGRPYVGDSRRIRERLGWKPTVGFEEMATRLVDAALAAS
jgi:GDPmannose 4,6-dehydratase